MSVANSSEIFPEARNAYADLGYEPRHYQGGPPRGSRLHGTPAPAPLADVIRLHPAPEPESAQTKLDFDQPITAEQPDTNEQFTYTDVDGQQIPLPTFDSAYPNATKQAMAEARATLAHLKTGRNQARKEQPSPLDQIAGTPAHAAMLQNRRAADETHRRFAMRVAAQRAAEVDAVRQGGVVRRAAGQ